ncbi:MAG TPA: DinB family protein [Candidatus Sulfotelmatobacter sp.]|nr:DinB family protein [Candidatus Sulfotelmatobacter sp.]
MSQRALTELLRGKGAHADPVACVEDVSAVLANRRIEGFPHSIAQIVFHINYWMSYELRRIRGEKPEYPAHAAESWPGNSAALEWDRLRRDLAWMLNEFAKLAQSSREELDREIESVHSGDQKVAGTLEAVLWQIVAHNSYHVGQIAMMRRAVGAWPPRAGGDSW